MAAHAGKRPACQALDAHHVDKSVHEHWRGAGGVMPGSCKWHAFELCQRVHEVALRLVLRRHLLHMKGARR